MVEIANPALAIKVFNYKGWLQKWHPTVQWKCACCFLSCAPTKSGHCFARATEATTLEVAHRNLSDTTWPPAFMFFATMEKSFARWCKLWGLPEQVQDEFNIFLMQQWLKNSKSTTDSVTSELQRVQNLVLMPADHTPLHYI